MKITIEVAILKETIELDYESKIELNELTWQYFWSIWSATTRKDCAICLHISLVWSFEDDWGTCCCWQSFTTSGRCEYVRLIFTIIIDLWDTSGDKGKRVVFSIIVTRRSLAASHVLIDGVMSQHRTRKCMLCVRTTSGDR